MSRRHHGGRPHRQGGHHRQPSAPVAPPAEQPRPRADATHAAESPVAQSPETQAPARPIEVAAKSEEAPEAAAAPVAERLAPAAAVSHDGASAAGGVQPERQNGSAAPVSPSAGCTAPQLRRFIKSRPYVPMHELRRRFGINGADDDVTAVDLADGRVYVGLPAREGGLLGELLRAGDIGFELSLDPRSPIVVGLYPMRPVPRP
jgi:hypothetical protein